MDNFEELHDFNVVARKTSRAYGDCDRETAESIYRAVMLRRKNWTAKEDADLAGAMQRIQERYWHFVSDEVGHPAVQ